MWVLSVELRMFICLPNDFTSLLSLGYTQKNYKSYFIFFVQSLELNLKPAFQFHSSRVISHCGGMQSTNHVSCSECVWTQLCFILSICSSERRAAFLLPDLDLSVLSGYWKEHLCGEVTPQLCHQCCFCTETKQGLS